MLDGVISASTITEANRNNARRNLSLVCQDANPIGQAGVNLGESDGQDFDVSFKPILDSNRTASGGGSFELADVSVTVGGEAARVLRFHLLN